MAKNLRSKIPSSDTMFIHDVNPKVTEEFAKEVGNVTIAQSVREVAENGVRRPRALQITRTRDLLPDEPILFYP